MKRNPLTLAIGILLILIFGLLLFVFQVRQSEVAVVTTFGKPTRDITVPGPYLKWPWPIQRVHKFDQRVQNFEDRLTEGLTSDSFNLLASVYVGWRITEPKLFFPRFTGSSQPITEAERVLEQRLSNIKTAVVSKHPLADFVAPTNSSVNIATIEEEMLKAIRSQVQANNWGVEIDFLGIKKLQLPEGVTASVFERMQSDRNALAARSQFEGEAEAQKIRSEAETKAAELLANAEGQATQIRAKGEAEAAKILPIFQKNSDLAVFLLRLNALEASLRERAILIFDQHTPPFDLFRGVSTNLLTK